MADPTYDFLASGGGSSTPSSGDPTLDFLSSGGSEPPAPKSAGALPLKYAAGGVVRKEVTGLGASAIAGVRSLYDLATGKPLSEIDKANQKFIQQHTYQPPDVTTKALASAFESNANPLNWLGKAWDVVGESINRATDPRTWSRTVTPPAGNPLLADKAGGMPIGGMPAPAALPTTGTGSTALGPIISGIGQVVQGTMAAAPLAKGLGGPEVPTARATPGWGSETPIEAPAPTTAPARVAVPAEGPPHESTVLTASGAARAPYFEPQEVAGRPGVSVDTEPVEGGLPSTAAKQRAAILRRVGLETGRESALEGNAKNAATDWQLTKFDEPAGVVAKAQFDAERAALQQHSEGLIRQTGGTLGTDEESLNIRGQTIARPFDSLADWFDTKRKQLYAAADQRSGGHPVVQPLSLQGLLDDPSFQNQLTARDQMHIRNGVAAELERFAGRNQPAMTVQNAEQFRQFLNTLWSPENSSIIGRLKGALDDDVMKGAGEDLYGPARAMAQLEKQTLENPDGVLKLIERDPRTPINRTTPFERIPDTLTRLPVAQFDNVMKTLQTMPEEIQPEAQQAIAEIKAHLVNKIHDAGSSTAGQWNARGVEKVVKANAAKLQSALEDQPEVLRGIQDLRSAGNILSVNQGYPGAAAQASNALKRGFMSHALSKVGATAGAGMGSVLGPFGAAGGAAVGEAVGSSAGRSLAEKSAVKQWQKGVKNLSEVER